MWQLPGLWNYYSGKETGQMTKQEYEVTKSAVINQNVFLNLT